MILVSVIMQLNSVTLCGIQIYSYSSEGSLGVQHHENYIFSRFGSTARSRRLKFQAARCRKYF